jgi:AraC-like DNA-binding protein
MSAAWVYLERRPPAALRARVDRLWTETVGDRADDPGARVLPDGCIDLVWFEACEPFVAGPAAGPVLTSARPGGTIVGLRFKPGMAASLLGVPANLLLNAEVPLADLWGRDLFDRLSRVEASASADARLAGLVDLVLDRLEWVEPGDALVAAAARLLAHDPNAGLGRLTALSGLSERQLRRRFETAVGYGPKTFQRIVRFRRWLRLARAGSGTSPSLSDLAAAAGYADQAHLTREASRLAGLPPSALLTRTPASQPDRP